MENEFTESVFPLTVTTIDVPEAVVTESDNTESKLENIGSRIEHIGGKIESTPSVQLFTKTPVTTSTYNREQIFSRRPSQVRYTMSCTALNNISKFQSIDC